MRLLRLLSLICVSLVLAACASGPKMAEIQSSIPTLATGEGRIFFFRENSPVGAAVQPAINLNGKNVGDSVPGGFFYVDSKAGPQQVSTTTELEKKLTFVLEAGQVRYVKTLVNFGLMVGRVYPELVDPVAAKSEIDSLSYTGLLAKK